jgi:hypothetical protein
MDHVHVAAVASQLMAEFRSQFPSQGVLDALGLLYPQFWAMPDVEKQFPKHLSVIKQWYAVPKTILVDGMQQQCEPILDSWGLDSEQGYFKIAMINNHAATMLPPYNVNPLTRLWRVLDAASVCLYPEYRKLAEITVTHVLGSVEDERCFSSVGFLKNKLRNPLDNNLEVVVGMYS